MELMANIMRRIVQILMFKNAIVFVYNTESMLPFSTHTPLHPVHFKPGQHPPSKVMPHSCPIELQVGFSAANKKCTSKI